MKNFSFILIACVCLGEIACKQRKAESALSERRWGGTETATGKTGESEIPQTPPDSHTTWDSTDGTTTSTTHGKGSHGSPWIKRFRGHVDLTKTSRIDGRTARCNASDLRALLDFGILMPEGRYPFSWCSTHNLKDARPVVVESIKGNQKSCSYVASVACEPKRKKPKPPPGVFSGTVDLGVCSPYGCTKVGVQKCVDTPLPSHPGPINKAWLYCSGSRNPEILKATGPSPFECTITVKAHCQRQ